MDSSMFVAAREGNTHLLLQLLHDDPLILERVTTSSSDTPLHVASMLGHTAFVKELIKRKSNAEKYVQELNQHGFCAIHMAAANGHDETVRELLEVTNNELCNLKGKNGMTPLHCACTKGRVETITRLLAVSCSAISEVTVRGETALHLAVKNNQFQALETLVDWLKQNNQLEILNLKDEEANTILHLAAARRNRQMLESLLKCNIRNPGVLQLNVKNQSGLTALDIVLLFPCETSYSDIEMVLKYAGAESSASLHQAENQIQIQSEQPLDQNTSPTSSVLAREQLLNWDEYFKFEFEGSDPNRVRSDLLLIVVLMATATYQAVLSPPGGISGETNKEGQATLAIHSPSSFITFMFCNSAGFFISMLTITELTNNYPLSWELYLAIFAMSVTYSSAMISLSPPGVIQLFFYILSIVMPVSLSFLSYQIRKWTKRRCVFAYQRHQQQNA